MKLVGEPNRNANSTGPFSGRLNKTSRQAPLLPPPLLLLLNPNPRPGDLARVLPSGLRPMANPVRQLLAGW